MHTKDFRIVDGTPNYFSEETNLELFRRICLCRYFELTCKKYYNQSNKKIPIYLSLGQESVAAALSLSFPEATKKFAQHRAHDMYLCFGGDIEALIDELLSRPTGCAGGMGGSASIHSPAIGMIGHDGHMGTQVPIGAGYSLGSNEKTLIVMGDASAEEGYVLGAMGEIASKKLPVLLVCTDNNLSVLTTKEVRRSWSTVNEAKAKGMLAWDITDDPWLIMNHVTRAKKLLPALLNINVCRELWHAGTGCDGLPKWNRFELTKKELARIGLNKEIAEIEEATKNFVEQSWEKRLKAEVKINVSNLIKDLPNPYEIPLPKLTPEEAKLDVALTISSITEKHLLEDRGLALGQCLTAVGWIQRTVPKLKPEDGLVELSMDDTSGDYIAIGCALAGRHPIFIARYQGFMWFNAAGIANYAAKAKEMWGYKVPIFVRSIAMEGSTGPAIGPVASNSHHGMFMRMPGIAVCAPMTPAEYRWVWKYYKEHELPVYVSEHRRSFKINYEMPDQTVYSPADITLFPISSTRLNAIEAAKTLAEEGIHCNIVHIVWLRPFNVGDRILNSLENSRYGGIVLDGDYASGTAKPIAFDIMEKTNKKIRVLALDDRTAGFAPHLDNLPPSPEKICDFVRNIIKTKIR